MRMRPLRRLLLIALMGGMVSCNRNNDTTAGNGGAVATASADDLKQETSTNDPKPKPKTPESPPADQNRSTPPTDPSQVGATGGHRGQVVLAKFVSQARPASASRASAPPLVLKPAVRLTGHKGPVRSAVFSSDGKQILTGGRDGTVRLWMARTGQQQWMSPRLGKPVNSVAMSRTGRLAASGGNDRKVRLWNVANGREVRSFTFPSAVFAVAFSPDGRLLAAAGTAPVSQKSTVIQLRNVDSGQVIRQFADLQGTVSSLDFSPDGKTIVACGDRGVRAWNVATAKTVSTFFSATMPLRSASYSADGKYVVTAGLNPVVLLWDAATFQISNNITGDRRHRYRAAASSNGRLLAIGVLPGPSRRRRKRPLPSSLSLWDLASKQVLARLNGFGRDIAGVSYSTGDDQLLTFGTATVPVWNLSRVKQRLKTAVDHEVADRHGVLPSTRDRVSVWWCHAVPFVTKNLPAYLKGAVSFQRNADGRKIRYVSFQAQRAGPVFLAIDWTYNGDARKKSRFMVETKRRLAQSGWLEIGRCPWIADGTLYLRQLSSGKSDSVQQYDLVHRLQLIVAPEDGLAALRQLDSLPTRTRINLEAGRLRDWLTTGQYDKLEQFAADLRKSGARYRSGQSKLKGFYFAVSHPLYYQSLLKWVQAKPASVTARLALARLYIHAGATARGNELAFRVTPQQQALMRRFDSAARQLLEQVRKSVGKDPMFYDASLSCAIGLGEPREKMRAEFLRAVEAGAATPEVLGAAVLYFLPRWYGKPGDLRQLAETAAAKSPAGDGPLLYALVAATTARYERRRLFGEFGFSWERVRRGYAQFQKRFPHSRLLIDQMAFMAALANDRKTAGALFKEIGTDLDSPYWSCTSSGYNGELAFAAWRRAVMNPVPSGQLARVLAHDQRPTDVAFSADGKRIATAGLDAAIHIWPPTHPKRPLYSYPPGRGFAFDIAFSFGSKQLVDASSGGLLVTWDLKSHRSGPRPMVFREGEYRGTLSDDGSRYVTIVASRKLLVVIDVQNSRLIRKIPFPPKANLRRYRVNVALSGDGHVLAYSAGEADVRVVDVKTGRELARFKEMKNRSSRFELTLSTDGHWLAAVAKGHLWGWDVRRKQLLDQPSESIGATDLAFSPDGKQLAVAHLQGVSLWTFGSKTKTKRLPGLNTGIEAVAWSPDGRKLALVGIDNCLYLWDLTVEQP